MAEQGETELGFIPPQTVEAAHYELDRFLDRNQGLPPLRLERYTVEFGPTVGLTEEMHAITHIGSSADRAKVHVEVMKTPGGVRSVELTPGGLLSFVGLVRHTFLIQPLPPEVPGGDISDNSFMLYHGLDVGPRTYLTVGDASELELASPEEEAAFFAWLRQPPVAPSWRKRLTRR